MGLGLQTGGGGGNVKPFVSYDARAGRLFKVDRAQDSSGQWMSEKTDITNVAQFVVDMANVQVGYINFTEQGPIKAMTALGKGLPARPEGLDTKGRPAFKQGFELQLAMPKDLGGGVRELSSTAGCVIEAVDELHDRYTAALESKAGKLPVVKIVNVMPVKNAQSTNYKPIFEIVAWVDRPPTLTPQGAAAAAVVADTYAVVKGVTPPVTGSTQVAPPPPRGTYTQVMTEEFSAAQHKPEPVGAEDFG